MFGSGSSDRRTGPLAGLRVLEVATLYSAPQIGALLGDLGADVVKVETPVGDPMRTMGQQRDGRAVAWELVARNKRSIVLDLDARDAGSETSSAYGVVLESSVSPLSSRHETSAGYSANSVRSRSWSWL